MSMSKPTFISRCHSIFTDNASHRMVAFQRSGYVDPSRLALCRTTDTVFKKPLTYRFARYHIRLLLDASGSMCHLINGKDVGCHNGLFKIAAESAYNLYKSLTDSGTFVSLVLYNRRLALMFPDHLKTFDAFLTRYKEDVLHQASNYCAGNHDDYAITESVKTLLSDSTHPGRIIFILSDGVPKCDYSIADCMNRYGEPKGLVQGCLGRNPGLEPLKQSIQSANRSGIITLGLGIGTSHIQEIFGKNGRDLIDPSLIYSTSCDLLERSIVRG